MAFSVDSLLVTWTLSCWVLQYRWKHKTFCTFSSGGMVGSLYHYEIKVSEISNSSFNKNNNQNRAWEFLWRNLKPSVIYFITIEVLLSVEVPVKVIYLEYQNSYWCRFSWLTISVLISSFFSLASFSQLPFLLQAVTGHISASWTVNRYD